MKTAALLALALLLRAAPLPAEEPRELVVFAAASLTEALGQIARQYAAAVPKTALTFNFDSSGTLMTQIKEGAPCDIFISAGQKQMDDLEKISPNPVLAGTRLDLLENQVVLAVPSGNPGRLHSFPEAARAKALALGGPDVPVGQYAEEIFRTLGLWTDELRGRTVWGGNVKEVVSWVKEGAVDGGVVYATDAASAGLEIAARAPAGSLKTRVLYPAAVMSATKRPAEAKAFLDYLKGPEASEVFKNLGFSPPPMTENL